MTDKTPKMRKKIDIKKLDTKEVKCKNFKNNLLSIKERTSDLMKENSNENEFGYDVIEGTSKNLFNKSKDVFKNQYKNLKQNTKRIKNAKRTTKTMSNVSKESIKTVKRSKQVMKFAKSTIKLTVKGIKASVKVIKSTIKGLISGMKALGAAITAGGAVAIAIIVLFLVVGLFCACVLGIFFSGEKTSENSITMKDVVSECNKEFSDKLQEIQDTTPHEEFVLDGSIVPWKDILIVYAVKQSNGREQSDLVTIDDNKKKVIKQIFWDMNLISSETRREFVTYQGTNIDEMPTQQEKQVLHIKITPKTIDQMKIQYNFSPFQNKQIEELMDNRFSMLWSNVIYGQNSGEYVNWRQTDSRWSSVRLGNTNSTIGQIGCLVTSISVLIDKSGVNTEITPFNPGIFVEALNKNGGFDDSGNLKYYAIQKVVSRFSFVGNVNLRGKTREQKMQLINKYISEGYYISAEVKGATSGSQHWVAVMNVNNNIIYMVDPASSSTDMWSSYEWSKTSQFVYFRAN